jgi:poly(3-hydroxybutyrate) depolymerase
MFIIYIAHCRGNALYDFIPARYGISDAANMFVFVSGMTCAIAFGGTFLRQGWFIGTARVAYRCLQLYAAQIGLFCAIAVIVALGARIFPQSDYIAVAELQHFFDRPGDALIGLLTLTYVPHYIDILPLYIVCLVMVPIAMALARLSPLLPVSASIALYAASRMFNLNLPAGADDQAVWYFDPFAWQLIFFTGFALRRGWIKVALESRALFWSSVAILLLGLAISFPAVFETLAPVDRLRRWIYDHSDKTHMDLLEYLHFLASAYVAIVLLKGHEHGLHAPALRPIVKCGQQALSIFISGLVLSYIGGIIFDQWGTGLGVQILVNGVTFALLVGIAYGVAWFKAAPWKERATLAALVAPAILLCLMAPQPTRAATINAYGLEENHVAWQGETRGYLLRVPPGREGALPLVLALHGAGDTPAGFAGETQLAEAGDDFGMMVAFPSGIGRNGRETFNAQLCCGGALTQSSDDIVFIGAVIEDVAAHHPLDRGRIYATGMSNGGMLVYQLAARHPEWFAAIAPVSATIGGMTRDGGSYMIPVPREPVSVMIIHGMRDGYVLYQGGASPNLRFPYRWKLGVPDALSFWTFADGCSELAIESETAPGKLRSTVYSSCKNGTTVRLWAIEDGDHEWPGAIFPGKDGPHSAATEILSFFDAHSRR